MEEKLDYEYMNRISTYYEAADHSINATADHFHITRTKVRKILITMGVLVTGFSEKAETLREQGLSIREIANQLDCSISTVSTYLPYQTVMYNGEEKSLNAIRLENYRRRVSKAKSTSNRRVTTGKEKEIMEGMRRTLEEEESKMHTDVNRSQEEMADFVKDNYYPGLVEDRYFPPEEFGSDILAKAKCHDVVRLHLELVDTDNAGDPVEDESRPWDREVAEELHRYGGVKYGNHISRDVLVPADMELWALHYMIQRAFGWQNSHLHRFYLPGKRFSEVTGGKAGNWANLVGLTFRNPLMDEYAEFWADDYESGSFKTWLRKKYTGPYYCLNQEESYWYIRDRFHEYQDYSGMNDPRAFGLSGQAGSGKARNVRYIVRWGQYKTRNGEKKPVFIKDCFPEVRREEVDRRNREFDRQYPDNEFSRSWGIVREEVLSWKDLPIDALRLLYERPVNELLERQEIQFVLAMGEKGLPEDGYSFFDEGEYCEKYRDIMRDAQDALEILGSEVDSPINQPNVSGITKEILYEYDFGDSWTVKITGSLNCADLVESGRVTQGELDEVNLRVRNTYRPVMICRDGLDLVDDLGGYSSIACFLRAINNDFSKDNQQYEDRESTIEWAKSLGWSTRNIALKNRL